MVPCRTRERVVAVIRARTATKKELLALPILDWGIDRGWWDALLIIPGRHKHDSGYAHIAIIGVRFGKVGVRGDKDSGPGEWASHKLAYGDDIQWPAQSGYPGGSMRDYGALRTDSYHPSGVLRLWSGEYEFSTTSPLSSVTILIRPKEPRQ